jgi:hypothetical protein
MMMKEGGQLFKWKGLVYGDSRGRDAGKEMGFRVDVLLVKDQAYIKLSITAKENQKKVYTLFRFGHHEGILNGAMAEGFLLIPYGKPLVGINCST